MPCSCDRKGMWDRRVSIGHTLNENLGMSTLEPLMELIIEHCTGKCNHSIGNEMVRSSNTKVFTPFANPERQFQSRKDITPIAVHNIYSFYESESSESESEDLSDIDIETLTLEQYLALNRNNSQVGELPRVTFKQIREIHNFWQEEGESLYQTWERFNELLFKCPFHDLNDYQKVNTFYKGLSTYTRQILDSCGLVTGLTAIKALESIQEKVDHSHRWHKEESDKKTSNNSFSTITEKLKILNHDMNNLRESIHKINRKPNMKFRHEEVKSMKTHQKITHPLDNLKETLKQFLEESRKKHNILDKWMQNFIDNTNKNLKKQELTIKKLEKKVVHLARILANQKDNALVMNSTSVQQECIMKLEPPQETPKLETFSEKVKRRIMETQANEKKLLKKLECEPVNTTLVNDIRKTPKYTRHLQELVSNKIKIEKLSLVKLNARCSVVLQNELPPKEKDPGSFVLPCVIGNTTVSNALADLGASISVMPFSMFKRLGLGNPRPVNMVIEMVDRSIQSPKRIVENVLVKIHKFIFPVDFVILDIVEDNKVAIILGRPMLATAHTRIDVFGGKISLEVGKEQVIFNANEGATPIIVSPVYVIQNFNVIDDIDGPEDLEGFLMNENLNGELGNFLHDDNLFPNYETNSPFPDKSSREIWSPTKGFQDSNNDFGSRIDELVTIDDLWGDLDSGALNRATFKTRISQHMK
ncbi:retrovirus-related pol polyprotein from transposon TNT 1-94 [Tanacetum coccineum]|uniref:Retrovirus-related pol polyprotein from transposon TNT 1-94 n=1 Tax=Tanacetum coccineum TaxID=301880 RepID=A0ABQ4YDX9_9ASTR